MTSGFPRGTAMGAGNLRSQDMTQLRNATQLNGGFKFNFSDSFLTASRCACGIVW